jgi:hypothetical protein
MTNANRLKELDACQARMRSALSSYDSFQTWQAETSALLASDPILRHQFIEAAKSIVRRGDFPLDLYDQHPKEMRRTIEQALADLRVLAAEDLHSTAPDSEIAVSRSVVIPSPQRLTQPSRPWTSGEPLGAEHGPLWFWHHCHYRVKWSLIAWSASAALVVLGAGFAAGRTNLFVRLFDVFHDTSATAPAQKPSKEKTAPTIKASDTVITK